jgi:hypothetical protein
MNVTTDQASAIAAVRMLRNAGQNFIAAKLTTDLMMSDLFIDAPLMESLYLFGPEPTVQHHYESLAAEAMGERVSL